MNEIDICRQFSFAIERAGLMVPEHIVADGALHRFAPNGSPHKKDAWYVLHADGIPAGAFGDWRTSVTETWVADIGRRLTPTEINSHKEKAEKARTERDKIRQAEYARAANHAKELWDSAKPAPFDHAYLIAKQIKPHGLRVYKGSLVVPIHGDLGSHGERDLMSLQFIGGDGSKRMLTGGSVADGLFDLGGIVEDIVCIAEGFATAASIYEATGYPVRVAFGTGNLLSVGKLLRGRYPSARIIYCADDDHLTPGNPGLTKAREAAIAVGATVVTPQFDAPRPKTATDFNDMSALHGRESVSELINGRRQETAGTDRFPFFWADEATVNVNPDYFVKGLLHRGASAMVFGPSGDGKTFFTIDMLYRVASGQAWRDRRVKPTLVIYIASEAGTSIAMRFVAWNENNPKSSIAGRRPFAVITKGLNLLLKDDVDELEKKISKISAEAGMPVGIIAFDTLSRSTAGADENSAQDMSAIIGAGDSLRDKMGAAVLYVHHSGKDVTKGARGSSALQAACDTVILVSKNVATIEKSRDGPSGQDYPFDLKQVVLAVDSDGDEISTCLVTEVTTGHKKSQKLKISGNDLIVLNALRTAISDFGVVSPGTSVLPAGVKFVEFDRFKTIAIRKFPPDEMKRINQKINRSLERLLAQECMYIEGNFIWIW